MKKCWIRIFGRWYIKVPEFIYNWAKADLCRAKNVGMTSIKIEVPDESKESKNENLI